MFFQHSHKPRRNTFVLERADLKKTELLGPSRDAQNICAVTKGGTVLNNLNPNIQLLLTLSRLDRPYMKDTRKQMIHKDGVSRAPNKYLFKENPGTHEKMH